MGYFPTNPMGCNEADLKARLGFSKPNEHVILVVAK